ncbi:MAG: BatD family protein [Campylobacterota bacterium]|nr:BatD family protein [Campylobacterota bacterium]
MNTSLGNKILKLLFLLILPLVLYGNVKLNAPNEFYKGDQIVFSITASGSEIEFPNIDKIGDIIVQSAGLSTSTSIINGQRSQTITKNFIIRPEDTITIPAIKIKVSGKFEATKPKTIYAKDLKKTVSKLYSLDIKIDKKDIHVAEQVRFTINFKYHKDLKIVDLKFYQPNFTNFWVKELKSTDNQKQQGDYIEQELSYIIFPQKSGKLFIEPLKIDLITPDERYPGGYGFFNTLTTKSTSVYSNKLELEVKPLPGNINLIGDFKISSRIDKNSVDQNEAVSFKLTIDGRGNIDDIDDPLLKIPNTTIYDNPAKKEFDIKNNLYGGRYSKTYSIVAQNDFVIPSIDIEFFDKRSNSVKRIKTKEYHIKVKNRAKKVSKLQTAQENRSIAVKSDLKTVTKVIETTDKQKIVYFILGFVSALAITFIYLLFKNKRVTRDETSFEKLIKNTKNKEQLLKLIVVYINIDKHLDKIIFDLEKSSQELELKQIKKQIIEIVKDKKLDLKI